MELSEVFNLGGISPISFGGLNITIVKVSRENLEAVARRVLELLDRRDGVVQWPPEGSNAHVSCEILRGCIQASSESEREMFARVMNGELESPGGTSKRLVDTIVAMDREEAELFLDAARFVVDDFLWGNDVLPRNPITDDERLRLHVAGLLENPHRTCNERPFKDIGPGRKFRFGSVTIINPTNDTIKTGQRRCDPLTRIGKLLFDVLGDTIQRSPTIKTDFQTFIKTVDERLVVK